jgi:predicted metal-binding protein
MGIEPPVPLMDVDEEIKMLEKYRNALTFHFEKVSERLSGIKRWVH